MTIRFTSTTNHPHRPWSHITLDFATSEPVSSRKSGILPAIDRFSKSGHFVSLDKLSSASENVKLFVDHVFRLHMVSDRGPQFTSEVWKTFCTTLGAKVSLSTGYHRLSNGQTESCRHVWTRTLEALLRTVDRQRCYGDRLRRPNPSMHQGLLPETFLSNHSLASSLHAILDHMKSTPPCFAHLQARLPLCPHILLSCFSMHPIKFVKILSLSCSCLHLGPLPHTGPWAPLTLPTPSLNMLSYLL